jgi:hypothetical protein
MKMLLNLSKLKKADLIKKYEELEAKRAVSVEEVLRLREALEKAQEAKDELYADHGQLYRKALKIEAEKDLCLEIIKGMFSDLISKPAELRNDGQGPTRGVAAT